MEYGQLSFHATLTCAAARHGCDTILRVGGRAHEIIEPIYHADGRAYANLYFKFISGRPYDSNGRAPLHIPKQFTEPVKSSAAVQTQMNDGQSHQKW